VVTGLDKEKASTVKHILHPSRFWLVCMAECNCTYIRPKVLY
jgi:hypothetical protein